MAHLVRKPFLGAGLERQRGEVVDAGAWRTGARLVALRLLVPLPKGARPDRCACGRQWADAAARAAHACPDKE